MNYILIVLNFLEKIIKAIVGFIKAQIQFIKNTWKLQGIKGILLLILNLIISFLGGFIYANYRKQKNNTGKKPQSGQSNTSSKRGQLRQPGNINRERRNDISDTYERRQRELEKGQDRDSEWDIQGDLREPSKTRKVPKSPNLKGQRDNTDNPTECKPQMEKNSRRNIGSQRRVEK